MWSFQHPVEVQAVLRELFTYILSMHVDPRSSPERTILCKYYLFRTPPLRKLVTFSPSMYLMQSYHYTTQMQSYHFWVHSAQSLSPCGVQILGGASCC